MKFTAGTLRLCIELAGRIGEVTDAHLYNSNFISIEGKTSDGNKFGITLGVKEEEEDA
jgi:hypothetical protein